MPLHDRVICGDSREVLKTLDDASCDAVITDPPYALTQVSRGGSPRYNDPTKPYGRHRLADKGFMGQQWDNGSVAHDPAFWAEVLRVARPGAFLLAFGGTRTYHRLACAIEDAGWEIRDQIVHWIYGSGFPKSASCLKPSQEPIVLAKAPGPLQPLQIDACRVATAENQGRPRGSFPFSDDSWGDGHLQHTEGHSGGRWPPNLLLSHHPACCPAGVWRVRGITGGTRGNGHIYGNGAGLTADPGAVPIAHYADADGYETVSAYHCVDGCPVATLDEQAGPSVSRSGGTTSRTGHGLEFGMGTAPRTGHDDRGGPSRFFPTFAPDPEDAVPFFYAPKAPRSERRLPDGTPTGHPTQKPADTLMRWLVRLVTPPGGTALDCFAGSGSTLVACVREGFGFIGIEQDSHYCDIARGRIAHARAQLAGPLFVTAEKDA